MGQEWELEAVDWGSDLDGLMFSARYNAIVFETNVEAFVRVGTPEPSPETETNFSQFNRVDEPGVPLPSLGRSRRLDEDLVANQHAGAFFRQTRDWKTGELVNSCVT